MQEIGHRNDEKRVQKNYDGLKDVSGSRVSAWCMMHDENDNQWIFRLYAARVHRNCSIAFDVLYQLLQFCNLSMAIIAVAFAIFLFICIETSFITRTTTKNHYERPCSLINDNDNVLFPCFFSAELSWFLISEWIVDCFVYEIILLINKKCKKMRAKCRSSSTKIEMFSSVRFVSSPFSDDVFIYTYPRSKVCRYLLQNECTAQSKAEQNREKKMVCLHKAFAYIISAGAYTFTHIYCRFLIIIVDPI